MESGLAGHMCCPGCGGREGYRLGDGRKKCRRCGRKYSRRLFRSRLSAKILKQIALYFWLLAPMASVARDLGLDPKTVRRHYDLMLLGITRSAYSSLRRPLAATEQVSLVLFCSTEGGWLVIRPLTAPFAGVDPVQDYRWWYSQQLLPAAPQSPVLCHLCLAELVDPSDRLQWLGEIGKLQQIVQRLWCRKNGRTLAARRQLLVEAAFRYNQRNNPGVTALLYGFMKSRPPGLANKSCVAVTGGHRQKE